ncbi:MAG: hypothetical protein WKF55_16035 [Gemmatimonadaceae bacterium]
MAQSAPRSLKHEYDVFVENEVENYKDSISRTTLLKIGDEAVAVLQSDAQMGMTELLLCDEVDRIIRKRLRIPSYATWRKNEVKRLKEQDEFLRPEHWGLSADCALAREVHPPADSRVLVAGAGISNAALYLAAHGCSVTAIDSAYAERDAALDASEVALLGGRVESSFSGLMGWAPAEPLSAVVCTPAAFAGLTAEQRQKVIEILQSATRDGGVHLVDTLIAGRAELSLAELRKSYEGWQISVLEDGTASRSFLARKAVA